MSRRDTIIVSVLINAGLLAILFITAVNVDDSLEVRNTQPVSYEVCSYSQQETNAPQQQTQSVARSQVQTPVVLEAISETPVVQEAVSQASSLPEEWVEVTVKRGDFLEGIARSNGVTVQEIMEINGLSSPHVRVGQILHIPVRSHQEASSTVTQVASVEEERSEVRYYEIQSGDNPWLISKKEGVKLEELLRLNNLDDRSARRLKPGDRIRVR